MKFQNEALTAENRRLETESEEAGTRHTQEVSQLQRELTATRSLLSSRTGERHVVGQTPIPGAFHAGPSTHHRGATTTDKGKTKSTLTYEWLDPEDLLKMDVDTECSAIKLDSNHEEATTSSKGKMKSTLTYEWLDPETLLQTEADAESSAMRREEREVLHQLELDKNISTIERHSDSQVATTSYKGKMKSSMPCEWLDEEELFNAHVAEVKQREYEAEDAALRLEREELEKSQQPLFDCGICLDEHPEDFVARVEQCQHAFCRNCIRDHIISWITDHRYPIFCPICMAGKARHEPAGPLIQSFESVDASHIIIVAQHLMVHLFSRWAYPKGLSKSTTSCKWLRFPF